MYTASTSAAFNERICFELWNNEANFSFGMWKTNKRFSLGEVIRRKQNSSTNTDDITEDKQKASPPLRHLLAGSF